VGSINDIFWFGDAMSFEFTISGGAVTGSIGGTGQSVAGMVPQTAIFQATFTGVRK
jgi:hypothetical protein